MSESKDDSTANFPPLFSLASPPSTYTAWKGIKGLLIAFEGIDRSGKSTQLALLRHYLESQGCQVAVYRFPDREGCEATSKTINAYLSGGLKLDAHAITYIFAANLWQKRDAIQADLDAGKYVLVDRYIASGVAYGAARGVLFKTCKELHANLPLPGLVFYMGIPVEDAVKRKGFGDNDVATETIEIQKEVYGHFRAIIRSSILPGGCGVDGLGPPDEIHEAIKGKLLEYVELKARNGSFHDASH